MTTVQALQLMLNQLDAHSLRVELAPLNPRLRNYNEGGMKRVVTDRPPAWYRQHCSNHPSSRAVRRGKFDTRIRRAGVLSAIAGLISGKYRGKYAEDLLNIAEAIRRKAA